MIPMPKVVQAPTVEQVIATLANSGWDKNEIQLQQYQQQASNDGLSHNGAYVVLAVLTKGLVTIVFEQNTASENVGGLDAAVTHPAVAVISSPKGKVACNPTDAELIVNVAADLG